MTVDILCGQVIDGIHPEPFPNGVIRVRDGKIRDIGVRSLVADVIDLSNCTVMPGFIDAHAHPSIGCCDYQADHLKKSSARKALDGLHRVQERLKAGWTTLRTAGSADVGYCDLEIRNAIKSGMHVGPRMVGAGHYLSVTGGGGDLNDYSYEQPLIPDGCIVNGPEEVRKAVRTEIKNGSDWIKLLVTGAFMSAGDNPKDVHFSPEEIEVAVQEASRHNVPVMAHAHSALGIKQAIKAGVRSIEHGTFLDGEGIELMVKNKTYLVPTIYIGDYFANVHAKESAQSKQNALTQLYRIEYMRNYRQAFSAGVKIGLGTDDVGFPARNCAIEFERLMDIGMTAMQAIQAGTSVNAELLRMEHLVGSIEPGKCADIIAVEGDPLKDIRLLQDVKFVMLNGSVVKPLI